MPSEKVFNVGCGVDSAYQPAGEEFGLPFPYVLCVSNRKRHKNELRTVEAFATADIDPRTHLVLTGGPHADLSRFIKDLNISARVNFMGEVAEKKLPSLYRGARALIFASLYEGFGLPILEAMACGTPVVTSNTTAMPETAGDAAVLVDPTSVQEISQAIAKVAEDTSLSATLRAKGLARAAEFSWIRTSDMVRTLLNQT